MLKILWLTNMPTIYRVHFFNELGKLCDLKVIFERYHATGVPNYWEDSLAENFQCTFLKTKDIGREGSIGFDVLKLPYELYDEVVISSYSSPTEMLALLKLKIKRIKYVFEVDGGIIKKDNFVIGGLKRFLISGADLYFSSSDQTSKYLQFYGARAHQIKKYQFTSLYEKDVLINPVSKEEKKEHKRRLGISEEKMILSVGQFIHRKGFDVLLKSYSGLKKDVAICIVGGTPLPEYKRIVEKYKMTNVYFVSNLAKGMLNEYYLAADIFVLPTREDIWGLVVNEAMAKGLPVVTTKNCVSGLELIENGKNGFIVSVENEEELLQKTECLISGELDLREMADNNLIKIRQYTFEKMAERHMEVFEERKRNEQ